MKTLQEIKDFAKAHGACEAQYKKFCELIESGDELKAWQTVLGNIEWLNNRGAGLDVKGICILAKGIGLFWRDNGTLAVEKTWENGQRHGVSKFRLSDGRLFYVENWKNGVLINGFYR